MSKWKKVALWKKILIGVVIGLIIGLVSPKAAEVISPLGDIFLRMLKMLIVPLVFFSICMFHFYWLCDWHCSGMPVAQYSDHSPVVHCTVLPDVGYCRQRHLFSAGALYFWR